MRIDGQRPPRWLTLGSQLFVLLALGLFFLSIKLDAKNPHFTSLLVPVLFASVLAVVCFHFFYWKKERRLLVRELPIVPQSLAVEYFLNQFRLNQDSKKLLIR